MLKLCTSCGYANRGKHWFRPEAPDVKGVEENATRTTCQACVMAKRGIYGGVVNMEGTVLAERPEEVIHTLQREEAIEHRYNHLSRIIKIQRGEAKWKILTGSPQLAIRLGKRLKKIYGGKLHCFGNHAGHRNRAEETNKTMTVNWTASHAEEE